MEGSIGKRLCRAMLFCTMLVMLFSVSGCEKVRLEKHDVQYLNYFDTITSITVYTANEEEWENCREYVEKTLEDYHRQFDIYNYYAGITNLKAVNERAGQFPVQVGPEIVELLQFAKDFCEKTNGRMNVAMGSVLEIWHEYRSEGIENSDHARIPEMTELQEAANHTDIQKVEIDEEKSTVYLADPQMSLDVGAVAKGYTAQKLCEGMRELGIQSALVSIGGNVQTIGHRGDGKPWRVGIQNPDTSNGRAYLHAVELSDLALVTSGVYQRFYEVDSVRYHHIINPDTLMPWWEYQSVTILCKDGRAADALSTAVFNMSLEEGKALIESMEETEAFWVLPDGTEVMSSGFGKYLKD